MINKLTVVIDKLRIIKLACFITLLSNSFFIYAKDIELPYWILDRYIQYSDAVESDKNNYLKDFRIKLDNDNIYLNNNKYTVIKNKVNDLSLLLSNDILKSSSRKFDLKPFIYPDGSINYLQFKTPVESDFAKLLLPKSRVIYKDNKLLLINKGLTLSFLKPANSEEFKAFSNKFPISNLPINNNIIFDYTVNADVSINTSRRFLNHLRLFNNDNIYTQLNNYITNISGIRLPTFNENINPMIIYGYDENGETIAYFYLFSDTFNFLDKIILKNYYGATREQATNMYPIGFFQPNIDKNYHIERQQRFRNETIEIQHFQITKEGKLQEVPVTSNCYSKFAIKDQNKHSAISLLLTSKQANNYLRFDGGKVEELDSMTLTLNSNEKKFCVNYQQAYSISFGKANSKQFFGNKKVYQQQVENFKKYNIDISNELEYITFENVDKTPLNKFLLNGNQAIYMNNTLFIVGKDYFVAYRQPTKEELVYTQ
ncbi:hypothetical protein [Candidatus Schmidhempelia bombi]|uniref:Uncharacterized protein n=1 Tax=Candidatus Schmidhempelia bombi str. Bimp TaxID=1387197 RepID=A0AB94IF68_9GAMM|nr:hypothetical protein [Candidatus Schmidhempelia bombi]TEA28156.1 hypothetical protein O970_00170 [Candidatus Schmidhempelia bombi str. Bimp]